MPNSVHADMRRAPLGRNYWLLLSGQGLARIGTAANSAGLVLLMLQSESPLLGIGTVQLALLLPWVFVGPVAGALVDRWPKRPTLIGCDLGRMALALLLLLFHQHQAALLLIVLAMTCLDVLFAPGLRAFIPELVSEPALPRAVSRYQFAVYAARILGTMASGVLTVWFGFAAICALNAATYLASAALLVSIRVTTHRRAATEATQEAEPVLASIVSGARYLRKHEAIRFIVVFFALASACYAAIPVVLPVAVTASYHLGEGQYASLLTAQSIGVLAGTWLAGTLGKSFAKVRLMTGMVGLWGVAVLLAFTTNHGYLWLAGLYVVIGTLAGCADVIYEVFLQLTAAQQFLGRVFSLDMALSNATAFVAVAAVTFLVPDSQAAVVGTIFAIGAAVVGAGGLIWAGLKREWRKQPSLPSN